MMVVLTTHFLNTPPSIFHTKQKDVKKNLLYQMLSKLNCQALGIKLNKQQLTELTYVLPNLITSTDECLLFITNQKINNKVSWYFFSMTYSLTITINQFRLAEITTQLIFMVIPTYVELEYL
jgi:small-conductance mechanosensitive channel